MQIQPISRVTFQQRTEKSNLNKPVTKQLVSFEKQDIENVPWWLLPLEVLGIALTLGTYWFIIRR